MFLAGNGKFYSCITLLLGLLSLAAGAQHIESSSTIKLSRKITEVKSLGKLKSGYFVYLSGYKTDQVVSYDHTLKLNWLKSIKCDDKTFDIRQFIQVNDTLYMFYTIDGGNRTKLFYLDPLRFNVDLYEANRIGEISDDKRSVQNNFNLTFSQDRSFLLLTAIEKTGNTNSDYKLRLYTFDKQMELLHSRTLNIPYDYYDSRILGYEIDNDGNAYVLIKTRNQQVRSSSYNAYKFIVWRCNFDDGNFSSKEMDVQGYYINDMKFKIDNRNNLLVFAGYFSSESFDDIKGIFYSNFGKSTLEQKNARFNAFENDVFEKLKDRSRNVWNYISNFRMRDLVLRSDGGAILFSEIFYITVVPYSTGNIYMPNTVNNITYYHYEDVLVNSINPNGEPDWNNVVTKTQVTQADNNEFDSYFVNIAPNMVMCTYNDNSSRSNNVLQYAFDPFGKITSESLFSEFAYISGAKQVYNNELLVPAVSSNYLKIYKLKY